MNNLKISFSTSLVINLPDNLCVSLFHCAVDHLILTDDVIVSALEYAFHGKMSFEEYLKTKQAEVDSILNSQHSDLV